MQPRRLVERRARAVGVVVVAALVSFALTGLGSSAALAQDSDAQPTQVDASPKGAIGLGLIGAELGVAIPALVGVDDTWPYIVFPAVGAVGGALLGHFLLDNNNHVEVSVATMTAGMALVIPALVLAVAATEYDPEEDMSEASLGSGALRIASDGRMRVAAPSVALVPKAQTGKLELAGVNLSLVSGRF